MTPPRYARALDAACGALREAGWPEARVARYRRRVSWREARRAEDRRLRGVDAIYIVPRGGR